MLTQLSTVKSRLGLTEFDVKDDALLTNALNAVSARFDKESNRTLAHTIEPLTPSKFTLATRVKTPILDPVMKARLSIQGNQSRRVGPDQGPPQHRQYPRGARRPPTLRPYLAINPHKEPPRRKRRSKQQHLQILISSIILNGNSQVCLHKPRKPEPLTKVNRAR